MPYDIVQQGERYCVRNKETKKIEKCHGSSEKAKAHMKALYASVDDAKLEIESIQLDGGAGTTLVAVGATNKPHLRQRGAEISITEDGEVRVPIARRGVYRHPQGPIIFSDPVFENMIKNHANRVTDYPVHLDLRHKDTEGALALLDAEDGGRLVKEDGWLVAYGKPTDEQAVRLIKSKRYRFASAEFKHDYRSNVVRWLSDDLEELDDKEVIAEVVQHKAIILKNKLTKVMEEKMTLELKFGNKVFKLEGDENGYILTSEDVTQITEVVEAMTNAANETSQKLEAANTEIGQLKERTSSLQKEIDELRPEPEVKIPEAFRLQLEAQAEEIDALKRQQFLDRAGLIMKKAEVKGFDKPTLDLISAGLRLEEFQVGERNITLEEGDNGAGLRNYYANLISAFVDTIPAVVPTQRTTQGSDVRLEAGGLDGISEEDLMKAAAEAWEV
jgi:TolA-binding protein